jgi:superfamily I DNA/RNA helicase
MNQTRIKIYGPPGTGKTTYCLDLLCEHLQAGDRVLFLSFTRAAKLEAYARLIKLFGAVPESATVSTIHALCLRLLSIGVDCLADRPNAMKIFLALLGVTAPSGRKRDTVRISLDFHGRLRNKMVEDEFIETLPFEDPGNIRQIIKQFEAWKKKEGYVDFTDLLQAVARGEGTIPKYDVVIIDEAQDLTTLQWAVVDRLYYNSPTVYVVGDDDQAVYSFLGADVDRFLAWPADAIRVLDQSYRLPNNILAYSQLLAKQIKVRQNKKVRGMDKTGHIHKDIFLLENLPYNSKPTELYLTRNAYMQRRVSNLLVSQGIPFSGRYSPFTDPINYGAKVFDGIRTVHEWRDRTIEIKEWKKLKRTLRKPLIEVIEDKYSGATETNGQPIPPLRQIFKGEDFDSSGWWSMLFPTLSGKLEASYKLAIKNFGIERCCNPTMELSTIHGAKGKEADRVYVCSALTDKLNRSIEKSDDEHRLFYVAITRAREELFLVHDETAGGFQYQFPKL